MLHRLVEVYYVHGVTILASLNFLFLRIFFIKRSQYISDSTSAPAAFQQPAPAAQLHQMQGTQATRSQRQGPGARRRQNQINRRQQGNAPRCLIHNRPAPCSGCQRHHPYGQPNRGRAQPRLGRVDLAALDQ